VADQLTFLGGAGGGGGGGLEDLEKNFLQPKEKEKKSCGVQSRKNIM
jgi:hypothetical protein